MQALPGFRDFLPDDCAVRNYIFARWREVARSYGFVEWNAPILEPTALYRKKSGDEIVGQLFSFTDKGEREVAMRPELTPTLARVVAAHEREFKKPLKWFSIGQFFRYEKQQRGRLREHFQLNCDIVGEASLDADIELIAVCIDLLRVFGFEATDFVIRISDREFWMDFLRSRRVPREQWENVLQVIDKSDRLSRNQMVAQLGPLAGSVLEVFENGSQNDRLKQVTDALGVRGLGDFVQTDLRIVRGLAYYTGLVFEAFDRSKRFRAIAGGGRYDNLIAQLSDGAVSMPALGFAMGDVVLGDLIKRSRLPLLLMTGAISKDEAIDVYIVLAKQELRPKALEYLQLLREQGLRASYSLPEARVRDQFQSADELRARAVAVIGDEWPDVTVKMLATGRTELMPHQQSVRWLARLARSPRKFPLLPRKHQYTKPSVDVEILALCDAATAHAGKLNIVGVFDQIMAKEAPIIAPPCSIAARIRFMKLEEGQRSVRIAFVDADGNSVLPTLDSNVDVQVPPNESSSTAQIVLGIQQLKLPQFGEYSIDLAIDGRVEKSIPLFAKQLA